MRNTIEIVIRKIILFFSKTSYFHILKPQILFFDCNLTFMRILTSGVKKSRGKKKVGVKKKWGRKKSGDKKKWGKKKWCKKNSVKKSVGY